MHGVQAPLGNDFCDEGGLLAATRVILVQFLSVKPARAMRQLQRAFLARAGVAKRRAEIIALGARRWMCPVRSDGPEAKRRAMPSSTLRR